VRDSVLALSSAYNDHDAVAASALYSDDGEHHEIAQGSVRRGRQVLRESLTGFLQAFADAHREVEGAAVDSRWSAAPYRLTGTLAAPLGPFEPNGQALDIRGVLVVQLDGDGRLITASSDYWDSATFIRQMRPARA
jgi:steroid delta-isomerase-like uncharacterized protein